MFFTRRHLWMAPLMRCKQNAKWSDCTVSSLSLWRWLSYFFYVRKSCLGVCLLMGCCVFFGDVDESWVLSWKFYVIFYEVLIQIGSFYCIILKFPTCWNSSTIFRYFQVISVPRILVAHGTAQTNQNTAVKNNAQNNGVIQKFQPI